MNEKNNIGNTLNIVMGKDANGNDISLNLITNQHLLITGTTGSGKDTFLCSLLYLIMQNNNPEAVKFILVDGTRAVLSSFQDSLYMLAPMITDMDTTPGMFKWLQEEIERRFNELIKEKVRNIDEYNTKMGKTVFPRIIVLIRELSEVMLVDPAGTEKSILRITQLTKAVGIHMILVSQLASENIFTGLIKANIPSRIAFNTINSKSSMVILDQPGAEKLSGRGDMLFLPVNSTTPIRLTSTYIKEDEIDRYVREHRANDYDDNLRSYLTYSIKKDELYEEAVRLVQSKRQASAPLLQRELQIGYSRASRMIDEMEYSGIISPLKDFNGTMMREVLK